MQPPRIFPETNTPAHPHGTITAHSRPTVARRERAGSASSRHQDRLIEAAATIRDDCLDRTDFQHSALCQVGLPRRRTESRAFERRNGRVSIRLEAGVLYDGRGWIEHPLPYGVIPRLVLVYLSSEAVRTRRREIELGDSVRRFLERLGMSISGGPRGGYAALRRQMDALAACRMSIGLTVDDRVVTTDAKPIRRFEAWLHEDGGQRTLWPGVLELSDDFYGTLIEHAVPLDPRALTALRHSALALDVYAWLAHRLRRVSRAGGAKLSWKNLYEQFGQEYGSAKDFKKQFRVTLRQALVVYPDARVTEVMGGITLYPSPAPIRQMRVFVSHQHGAQCALSA